MPQQSRERPAKPPAGDDAGKLKLLEAPGGILEFGPRGKMTVYGWLPKLWSRFGS